MSIEEVLFTYRRPWRIVLLMVITDRICSRRRVVCMEGTNISSAILSEGRCDTAEPYQISTRNSQYLSFFPLFF